MKTSAKKLIEIFSHNLAYCAPDLKASFHREGKKVLRILAKMMGLNPGDYDIRSNRGGIAVSGEVTLHTSTLYVQIEQYCMDGRMDILMRSCNGRTDYVGGMNHFAPIGVLGDLEQFAAYLQGVADGQVCGMHWNPTQYRIDVAHNRANRIISPEL